MENKEVAVDIPRKYSLNQQQQVILPLKSTIWACAEVKQKAATVANDFSSIPKVGSLHLSAWNVLCRKKPLTHHDTDVRTSPFRKFKFQKWWLQKQRQIRKIAILNIVRLIIFKPNSCFLCLCWQFFFYYYWMYIARIIQNLTKWQSYSSYHLTMSVADRLRVWSLKHSS